MIAKAQEKGVKLLLPTDTVAATEFAADAESRVVPTDAIPDDMEGLDIGPETVRLFCNAVRGAGTVVWNGPMGVFEFDEVRRRHPCHGAGAGRQRRRDHRGRR